MARIVPESNHRPGDLVFIAQGAEARCTQHEISAVGSGFDPQPPGRQDPNEMSTGEKQDVALYCAGPVYNSIGASADLPRRFSSGAAVAKQIPAWAFGADLGATASFILAIIPLDEIGVDLCDCAKSGQFTSPVRPLQWACEHLFESQPFEDVLPASTRPVRRAG